MLKSKDELQAEIVAEFLDKKKGYILAAGGVGKSRSFIKCVKALDPSLITHLIVPSIQLKEQWEEHVKTWEIPNMFIYVVNSYIKTDMKCDILGLDEVHRYTEDQAICFNQVIHNNTCTYFLAMTATLKKEHINMFESMNIYCIKYVSFKEAVANNWVSPFIEYNMYVNFTDEEQLAYDDNEILYNKSFNYFFRNYDDASKCINKGYREAYCNLYNKDNKLTLLNSLNFHKTMKKRKDLIYNAKNKLKAILNIIEDNPDDEGIIFSESTAFCNEVHNILPNSTVYHSKISDKVKKANLESWLNGYYKFICTVRGLDQGTDKPSVSLGIIASGTGSSLQHEQRIFRATRFIENKQAKVYNLIVKSTQEETWLKKRQKLSKAIIL